MNFRTKELTSNTIAISHYAQIDSNVPRNIPPDDFSDLDNEDTSSEEWEDEYWRNEKDSYGTIEEEDEEELTQYEEMFNQTSQYYEVSDSEEDNEGIVYEVSKKDAINDRKSRED